MRSLKELALRYKGIEKERLERRDELLYNVEMRDKICDMMANKWEEAELLQPAIIATINGQSRLLEEIIEEKVAITRRNECSWLWAQAQIRVNEQRDKIDMFICELIELLQEEGEKGLKEEGEEGLKEEGEEKGLKEEGEEKGLKEEGEEGEEGEEDEEDEEGEKDEEDEEGEEEGERNARILKEHCDTLLISFISSALGALLVNLMYNLWVESKIYMNYNTIEIGGCAFK